MEEVYISNRQTGIAVNPVSEDTQIEIGDKLNDIKDILMSPAVIVLNELSDVNIENPTDGQIIKYNMAEHKWENVGFSGHVSRGYTSSYDFSKTNFTTNSQWHALNLSDIVPEGATTIHIKARMTLNMVGRVGAFRKNGDSGSVATLSGVTQGIDIPRILDGFVSCDSNRVIEYYFTSATWTAIDVVVRGWM